MKKKILLLMGILSFGFMQAQVGINTTTPDASAALDINGTVVSGGVTSHKGVLIPRMTKGQKDAILNPAPGLLVYDTDLRCISQNAGTAAAPAWVCLSGKDPVNAFFYMPTIDIPATEAGTIKILDLYDEYKKQFTGVAGTHRNPTAPANIPYFATPTDLDYYVTRYDDTIVKLNSISNDGKLSYQILKEADYSSFMTIVFVVK